ncbi:MAG: YfiR family protein [Vicinamibacterales bacterium]
MTRILVSLALLAVLVRPITLVAQDGRPEEYQVKAAYLYNFGRFVEWPATLAVGDEFPVCVIGIDPFGTQLDDAAAGLKIEERPVSVRRVDAPVDARSCRVLFIGETDAPGLARILAALSGAGVLTVGESASFAQRGGMIQFVSDGSRVRFIVNRAAAESAGLGLRADLLRVASRVLNDRPAEVTP